MISLLDRRCYRVNLADMDYSEDNQVY